MTAGLMHFQIMEEDLTEADRERLLQRYAGLDVPSEPPDELEDAPLTRRSKRATRGQPARQSTFWSDDAVQGNNHPCKSYPLTNCVQRMRMRRYIAQCAHGGLTTSNS